MDLPAAARAHQRQGLAGGDVERHLGQRQGRRTGVAEGHALELDLTAGPADPAGVGGFDDLGTLVQQLDDPFRGGRGGVEGVPEAGQVADRAVELADQGQEDQQSAQRELALRQLPGAQAHDGETTGHLDELDHRPVDGTDACRGHRGLEPADVLALEAALLPALPVVRLDQGHVPQRLLGDGAQGATAAPALSGRLPD